jgi:hypothetical protein
MQTLLSRESARRCLIKTPARWTKVHVFASSCDFRNSLSSDLPGPGIGLENLSQIRFRIRGVSLQDSLDDPCNVYEPESLFKKELDCNLVGRVQGRQCGPSYLCCSSRKRETRVPLRRRNREIQARESVGEQRVDL